MRSQRTMSRNCSLSLFLDGMNNLEWLIVLVYLGLATQPVHKGHIREESIFIFRLTKLSEQFLDIVLWDLITKIGKNVLKLSKHHCAIAVFVVQLEKLNIVVVGSRWVRSGLGSVNLLNNVIKLGKLLSFFISLSKADTNLLGSVHTKSVHHISKVEQVKLTLAIPVIDVTDLLHGIGINHLVSSFENTLVITTERPEVDSKLLTRWLMPMS